MRTVTVLIFFNLSEEGAMSDDDDLYADEEELESTADQQEDELLEDAYVKLLIECRTKEQANG